MDLLPDVYKGRSSKVLCIGQGSGGITTTKLMTPEVVIKFLRQYPKALDIRQWLSQPSKGEISVRRRLKEHQSQSVQEV